jgi:hypothetical protein
MSMRHSLEFRTPFLNVELARFVEALPASVLVKPSQGKLILREIASRYLPERLVNLPKHGFGLPTHNWARKEFCDIAWSVLENDDARLPAAIGREAILNFIGWGPSETVSLQRLWSIVMLETWLRCHPAIVPELARNRGTTQLHDEVICGSIAGSQTLSASLESVMTYAAGAGLSRFVVDGANAGEYVAKMPADHPVYQQTDRPVKEIIEPSGRLRIEVPFQFFGHVVCTRPSQTLGLFWCFDLLKSGYAFIYFTSPSGTRKVSLAAQVIKNCLTRLGAKR